MIKKSLAATLVWLILSALAAGCGEKQPAGDARVVITFWHSFVANTIPSLNALIQKFESEHPGIRIHAQYVPTGDALVHKLVTAVQSKTAPDISWIHADFLDKLVQADAIFPMDDFTNGPDGLTREDFEDIFPASLEAGKWKGILYALPMEATSLALLYNKNLFKKVGIHPDHPPQTWDDLRNYAKKLTVDSNGDGTVDQYGFFVPVFPASGELNIWMNLQWAPFLWQAGGEEFNDDQTKVLFNSPAGVAALTLWKKIYEDLDFSRFSLSHDMGFASQKLAMILDGPWNLPRYR
ncbi:MAG: extracellular solute-binding protein, partial [Ignavibacteriales bacterium]|nr:extracellular solute-binding protein [Ignavibacteriales bacterium]